MTLELRDTLGGYTGWRAADVGKTVVVLGSSIRVDSIVNSTTVRGTTFASIDLSLSPTGTDWNCFASGRWQLLDGRTWTHLPDLSHSQTLSIVSWQSSPHLSVAIVSSPAVAPAGGFAWSATAHVGMILSLAHNSSSWAVVVEVLNASAAVLRDGSGSLVAATRSSSLSPGEWHLFRLRGGAVGGIAHWHSLPSVTLSAYRQWYVQPQCCDYADFSDNTVTGTESVLFLDTPDTALLEGVVNTVSPQRILQCGTHPATDRISETSIVTSFSRPNILSLASTPTTTSTTTRLTSTLSVRELPGFLVTNATSTSSAIIMSASRSSLLCRSSLHYTRVVLGCPPSKHFRVVHSSDSTAKLPVNYRPPSRFGRAIPISDNIYNGNPTRPMRNNRFALSQRTGSYKRCAHPDYAQLPGCACSEAMRASELVADSDCIDRAVTVSFSHLLVPKFEVIVGDRVVGHLQRPVLLWELNNRTDFCINTSSCSGLPGAEDVGPFVLNPAAFDALMWWGDELYHFRVALFDGSGSHCRTYTDFKVYVTQPPLNQVAEPLIQACTAVIVNLVLFFAYLAYVRRYGIRASGRK